MITIKNFYPTSKLLRSTLEFGDEKLIDRSKSLTYDNVEEIEYSKIFAIVKRKLTDLHWFHIIFFVFLVMGLLNDILGHSFQYNPTTQLVEKVVVLIGLLLFFLSLNKVQYVLFLGADDKFLTSLKVNRKNRQLVDQAIQLVKKKTQLKHETDPAHPFPDEKSLHEIVEFDFPDFLNTSTTRFYEDRLIDSEKSLFDELVSEVSYKEFSGKTKVIRMANPNWGNYWCYWPEFVFITLISAVTFFPPLLSLHQPFIYIWGAAFLLSIPWLAMQYVKSDRLIFYGHRDEKVYLGLHYQKNKEKLDQIMEFVKKQVEQSRQTVGDDVNAKAEELSALSNLDLK